MKIRGAKRENIEEGPEERPAPSPDTVDPRCAAPAADDLRCTAPTAGDPRCAAPAADELRYTAPAAVDPHCATPAADELHRVTSAADDQRRVVTVDGDRGCAVSATWDKSAPCRPPAWATSRTKPMTTRDATAQKEDVRGQCEEDDVADIFRSMARAATAVTRPPRRKTSEASTRKTS